MDQDYEQTKVINRPLAELGVDAAATQSKDDCAGWARRERQAARGFEGLALEA